MIINSLHFPLKRHHTMLEIYLNCRRLPSNGLEELEPWRNDDLSSSALLSFNIRTQAILFGFQKLFLNGSQK
jgi:hypothetical protein